MFRRTSRTSSWCAVRRIGSAATAAAALAVTTAAMAACPFAIAPNTTATATRDARALLAHTRGISSLNERAHVAMFLPQLDVTLDGRFDELDSLIIARVMLGFRNEALTTGLALSGAGVRESSAALQTYFDTGCPVNTATQSVWNEATFTESSEVIRNPERGFWVFLTDNFANATEADLGWFQTTYPDITLGYAVVRLDAFRNQTLSQAFLDGLNTAFSRARARGIKLILRFAYNYPAGEATPIVDDAPLPRVLEHIAQLGPLVRANADVIYVWQAGFIGLWGEGHGSTNGLDSAASKAVIRDALLSELPPDRFLMWRYPPDQMAWDPSPGDEADAFGNTRKARMGMYNDCFMSSDTDVGTYSDNPTIRATQRAYVAARSAIAPFGGETCNAAVASQQRRSCSAIMSEGPQFHMSYLNRTYYNAFHAQWQSEGCFESITKNLGYRWVLNELAAPKVAIRSRILQASLSIKNVGWARLYNARSIVLQLVSRANPNAPAIIATTACDPRMLKPGETSDVLFQVTIPPDATTGVYDVFVAAPDAAPTIAQNGAYSIRFANAENVVAAQGWNAARGAFKTGATIEIR